MAITISIANLKGPQGSNGNDGSDATINGKSAIFITGGENAVVTEPAEAEGNENNSVKIISNPIIFSDIDPFSTDEEKQNKQYSTVWVNTSSDNCSVNIFDPDAHSWIDIANILQIKDLKSSLEWLTLSESQ